MKTSLPDDIPDQWDFFFFFFYKNAPPYCTNPTYEYLLKLSLDHTALLHSSFLDYALKKLYRPFFHCTLFVPILFTHVSTPIHLNRIASEVCRIIKFRGVALPVIPNINLLLINTKTPWKFDQNQSDSFRS